MNCGREQNPIQGCPVEVKVYNPHEKNVDARTIRIIKLAKYRLKAQVEKDESLSGEGQSPRVEKDEGLSGEG